MTISEGERFRRKLGSTKSAIKLLEPWPTAHQLRESRAKLPDSEAELRALQRELPIPPCLQRKTIVLK